ncbi:hypothetical protein K504DRAFT_505702 [Pleomassaria siparia CBS 279.74]|uniref:Uncharacterized protein n=1 Tax=Pleomassaria siparia CBS 279.74 TaxID=1314801 RepID=A0A6G1K0D9_9PLEO|nr:hypothetical protein K504DRAFT_505702 [Pleomassaria siparia CBS 279.74]
MPGFIGASAASQATGPGISRYRVIDQTALPLGAWCGERGAGGSVEAVACTLTKVNVSVLRTVSVADSETPLWDVVREGSLCFSRPWITGQG